MHKDEGGGWSGIMGVNQDVELYQRRGYTQGGGGRGRRWRSLDEMWLVGILKHLLVAP